MKNLWALIIDFWAFLKEFGAFVIDFFKSIFYTILELAIYFYGFSPADYYIFLKICIRDFIAYIWLFFLILWSYFDDYWYLYLLFVLGIFFIIKSKIS